MSGAAPRTVLVLGDQLNVESTVFDEFRPDTDVVVMAEVAEEARYVPQHRQRLVLFFAAMRHFRDGLLRRGWAVHYTTLDDPDSTGTLGGEVRRHLQATGAGRLVLAKPGDHRVEAMVREAASEAGVELDLREDRHFLSTPDEFNAFLEGRRRVVMEDFYRHMRRRHDLLMDGADPVGGRWNLDRDNRAAFGADGPGEVPPPRGFPPDTVTGEVMELVRRHFPDAPGRLDGFDYPVTPAQAGQALDDFIRHRLPRFGTYQDAMATGQPFLYHSRLSAALNLHLLDPREVLAAAVKAWEQGAAPLNAVEGFVRQVLGWREFVRGIYWREMPGYAEANALDARLPVPDLFWTGATDMNCLARCVGQLVDHAYAHHIQRLMVMGLFALLLGCRPYDVHRWHLSMYADAVDWVSLPNVLGMSQYGDGGLVGTKPYCASGNYIRRMSDYCRGCRYDPARATGDNACPFTTLYWDFLRRHRSRLQDNRRMGFQYRNLARKNNGELAAISRRAGQIQDELAARPYLEG